MNSVRLALNIYVCSTFHLSTVIVCRKISKVFQVIVIHWTNQVKSLQRVRIEYPNPPYRYTIYARTMALYGKRLERWSTVYQMSSKYRNNYDLQVKYHGTRRLDRQTKQKACFCIVQYNKRWIFPFCFCKLHIPTHTLSQDPVSTRRSCQSNCNKRTVKQIEHMLDPFRPLPTKVQILTQK